MFLKAGVPAANVLTGRPYLPGFYRARKQWDIVVKHGDQLVAAVEFKSQVGSVSKILNNRLEGALGPATDILAAHKVFQPFGSLPPWLGLVLVLEETTETERAPGTPALFPSGS